MDIALYKLLSDDTLDLNLENIDTYVEGPAAALQVVVKAMLTATGSIASNRGWGSGKSLLTFVRGTHARPNEAMRAQVAAMVALAQSSIVGEQSSGTPLSETIAALSLRDVQIFSDLSIHVFIQVLLGDGNSFLATVPLAR